MAVNSDEPVVVNSKVKRLEDPRGRLAMGLARAHRVTAARAMVRRN